jgi:Fic family protein
MIENRLLNRIEKLKAELDAQRPLSEAILARLKEQLDLEWIYNSNAIEGNTLTLRETQLILEHGVTIGGKSLREHFEAINHRDAINYVQELAAQEERITASEIRQLHQLVLAKIDDENAGRYRQIAVRIAGAKHTPPDAWDVPSAMEKLMWWLADDEAAMLHPVERAARAHHQFVAIHPFVDGNGRTGRLLMNLLLFRAGYPPAVIEKIHRRQYYSALSKADAGNLKPLVNFVGRACERSLRLYVEAVQRADKKPLPQERWIPLAVAAQGTPYTAEYLGLLARLGRINAKKQGHIWVTTQAAITSYQKQKYRRH